MRLGSGRNNFIVEHQGESFWYMVRSYGRGKGGDKGRHLLVLGKGARFNDRGNWRKSWDELVPQALMSITAGDCRDDATSYSVSPNRVETITLNGVILNDFTIAAMMIAHREGVAVAEAVRKVRRGDRQRLCKSEYSHLVNLTRWTGDETLREMGITPTNAGLADFKRRYDEFFAAKLAYDAAKEESWQAERSAWVAQQEAEQARLNAQVEAMKAEFATMSPVPEGYMVEISDRRVKHPACHVLWQNSFHAVASFEHLADYELWRVQELARQERLREEAIRSRLERQQYEQAKQAQENKIKAVANGIKSKIAAAASILED